MTNKRFYLLESKAGSKKSRNKNRIILNTCVSLSRNLAGYKFVDRNEICEKNALLEEVKKYIDDIKDFKDFYFYRISDIKGVQRDLLFKEYMINPEVAYKVHGRGIFVKKGKSPGTPRAIVVNHDDHLRIQSICPDLQIHKAYNSVLKIEKRLEKRLSFAFDRNLGYLTASPFNLGTGLRITVVAHLPVLAVSQEFADLLKRIGKIGYQVSGYYVEQSEIVGNLFKIFNRITLGKGEDEIIKEMHAICSSIIEEEQNARTQLKKSDLLGIKDNIYRSYGLLKYAKILSYEEALELLSIIRLGLDLEIIDGVSEFDFFELMNKISNSRILVDMEISGKVNDDYIDSLRADIVRKKILKEVD